MNPLVNFCALCGGQKVFGYTTTTVDLGSSLIVIRQVPAQICELCGEEWLNQETAQLIEHLAQEAQTQQRQVEIVVLTSQRSSRLQASL
jgi:YgiT-type zinc finger domain-containing protein